MKEIYSQNHITLLHNGEALFTSIEASLDEAVHEIYILSYIFKNDHIGRRIAEALRRAALRGVRTHLLIDGFGSKNLPHTMIDYMKAGGIMVRKFRPKISPWTFRRRRLRRLHRKIVVVDLKIAFVGGMNIQDQKITSDQAESFYDFAVSVEGPLVRSIYSSCVQVWTHVTRNRLRFALSRKRKSDLPRPQSPGTMRVAFLERDNFHHRRDIENAYLQAINQADTEIIIANAYFLPGMNFRHALCAAARRGVRVVLLLQGKMDHRLFHFAAEALYGSFLDAGIEIYEHHKAFLHAKVAVIDSYWATFGSSNLDPFSLLLSLEANVVVLNHTFATALKASLDQAISNEARRIWGNAWKLQPLALRLVSWFSYGLVRFMVGIAGYAPNNWPERIARRL
ncbi:cardiolipin synthase ClsB [Desulfosediminicola ganghwensis]|uniref:cardiolipin synthase ClsB n=1 Tax=Desulfosediminicola ganghwensis TaxID=2569540 RepID=UPI0010ABE11A|nr:cardiolipin synthase ClsB [Desulfosediminicola ganghwensis]